MGSASHIIDTELALERAGGNADLARELYQMLQKELPVYQDRIRSLYETNNLPALTDTVHKLNGSATYCGVPALKSAADTLESRLKRGESEQYQEGLEEVLHAIEQVMETPTLPL
jgi:two-component system sensor histidine kinase BarA